MSERERDDLPERESEPNAEDENPVEQDSAGRNEVDEQSEESFPASDPPSY